ncbi:hypothetical protein [Fastidiosibacter lacustris]|uniref:hypothetical protein n=1 Tax=Fastidiosibacter lacustris TaxID=2056695 RepID=UPI000E356703|nr:hypothetical protein [Fastidiosibacter lacustris]
MRIIKIITIYTLILPTIILAYDLSQKTQADQIIRLSKEDGVYHPKLKIKGIDNKQSKRNVYQNEYGVVVIVSNQSLIKILHKANDLAYQNPKFRPTTTPHITIVQGVYKGDKFIQLQKAVKSIAEHTFPYVVTMQNSFTKGGGGNTFLNVSDGKYFFDRLTTYMTNKVQPDAPMKQTLDDIEAGVADLKEMHVGGAWRDFNLPYNNNPHITVVYGKNDPSLLRNLNEIIQPQSLSFIAKAISIYQIDEVGNLYGKPLYQVNFNLEP